MLAEAAHLSQPQAHPLAIAPRRPAHERELHSVVPRHQPARAGAGAGARRRRAHREQRHHRPPGASLPDPAPDPGRASERGGGIAAARGRPASRFAHSELPLRVRPAWPAEIGRGARELCRERLGHRAGRAGPRKGRADRILATRRPRGLSRRGRAHVGTEVPQGVRRARRAPRPPALSHGR